MNITVSKDLFVIYILNPTSLQDLYVFLMDKWSDDAKNLSVPRFPLTAVTARHMEINRPWSIDPESMKNLTDYDRLDEEGNY